jgi:hypothetical protein
VTDLSSQAFQYWLDKRDCYDGPPPGLPLIGLIWSDPPVVHNTGEGLQRIKEAWGNRLLTHGKIIYNSNNSRADNWYEWTENQILENSNPGELVVDCFCGGSTTGVAALRNGRKYYGCDIEMPALILSLQNILEPPEQWFN